MQPLTRPQAITFTEIPSGAQEKQTDVTVSLITMECIKVALMEYNRNVLLDSSLDCDTHAMSPRVLLTPTVLM